MTHARRKVSWEPLVRAAVPACPERFTSYDVVRVMGRDANVDSVRHAVFDALCRLADAGELAKETRKRGETRSVTLFSRTASFRASAFDFAARRRAAEFLQGLSIHWGNERNRSRAQAD